MTNKRTISLGRKVLRQLRYTAGMQACFLLVDTLQTRQICTALPSIEVMLKRLPKFLTVCTRGFSNYFIIAAVLSIVKSKNCSPLSQLYYVIARKKQWLWKRISLLIMVSFQSRIVCSPKEIVIHPASRPSMKFWLFPWRYYILYSNKFPSSSRNKGRLNQIN